jgi:transmembrane sensor
VVTQGVVKIWSTAGKGEPVLVPVGHRALIDDQNGIEIAELSAASSDQQLAWREGRIVLDDITLGQAAIEFNRYHDVQLVVAPDIADEHVIGWFRTDDIDGFANASAATVGGRVERDGRVIRILR